MITYHCSCWSYSVVLFLSLSILDVLFINWAVKDTTKAYTIKHATKHIMGRDLKTHYIYIMGLQCIARASATIGAINTPQAKSFV